MSAELKRLARLLALGVAGILGLVIYREIDARRSAEVEASRVQLSPGEIADTSFHLPLAHGGVLTSDELRGKPVILNFWASWCDACEKERPQLARIKEFAGDQLIGVGTQDEKEKLVAYDKAHPHGYRILIDESGDVASQFHITGLPHTFLLGPDGKVLARVVGALRDADVEELQRLFAAHSSTR